MKLRIWAVIVCLLLPALSMAQIDSGSIVGTVTDQTGAVIPLVKITVTNRDTGVAVTATSNTEGQYQVLALIPGSYTVRATTPGMTQQQYDNVEIHVQSRPALDFHLVLGEVKQAVTVDVAAPLLQTQGAELGGVVNSTTINALPLNGRVYAQLALLEAGAGKYYSGPNETADRFSINGNSELQNYFALDGIDNNSGSTNLQEGSVQVVQPPPDALEEIRVQTRTYSAEFGTAAGGVINVSTKSGTNQFHGDFWEFLRNNRLDANTFFNNAQGVGIGHFNQNQYGGTLGGPILRNRTFFFTDFQGFNSRRATTMNSTVPTPLMKQGNFSELPFALASVVPSQSGCIANNVIRASCIDPVGQKLLALYPAANNPGALARQGTAGSFTGGSNYQYQTQVPNDTYSTDVRIDHNLNDRNKIFGRYSYYRVNNQDPPWTSNALAGSSNFASATMIRGNSGTVSWNDTISPALFNEVRFGINRMSAMKNPLGDAVLGKSAGPQFGLNGVPDGPFTFGLPPISIGGVTSLGSSPWRPQKQVSEVFQLMDDLSYLKGSHSLKFGYQYYRFNNEFLDIRSPQGEMGANGIYTNTNGFGVSDFLLGDMSSARFTTPLAPHNFRPGHALYAQDTWRATKKMTLNYGLRYELFAPLMNHQNQVANFTAANGGGLVSADPHASSWEGRSLLRANRTDFAPRFGLAYQLRDRWVVRGGYGIFFQHGNRFGSESVMNLNPPFVVDSQVGQNQGSTTPEFLLSNGFPGALFTASNVSLPNLQIRAQDTNQKTSYVEQASFGTQIQIARDLVLDTDWVGNYGHKMSRIRNANQGRITGYDGTGNPVVAYPYPNLSDSATGQHAFLEYLTNDGNTAYNALQIALRRRASHGLSFGLSYTLSHNVADFNVPINGDYAPQNAYNMSAEHGDSSLDVRHRLVGNMVWALPIGQGGLLLNSPGRMSRLIGGWQVNSIVTLQTGNPFTINSPDQSGTGGNHASRANCLADPFQGASSNPRNYVAGGSGFFINPASFGIPANGHFGSCAPFSVHGPGLQNVDLSLFKSFQVTENKRFELRGEFFNALNHANFAAPSSWIGYTGSFGKVYNTVGDARQIQLALKFYF